MRLCPLCEGPLTKCSFCGRYHCDDWACMPTSCAVGMLGEENE